MCICVWCVCVCVCENGDCGGDGIENGDRGGDVRIYHGGNVGLRMVSGDCGADGAWQPWWR